MVEPLLIAAHEFGHIAVSQGVEGIRADDDGGWTIICDGAQTQDEFLAQMVAGALGELIVLNGAPIALLKIKVDKTALHTEIGEHDWHFIRAFSHQAVNSACERIAPIIAAELSSLGKLNLVRTGSALLALTPGQMLRLRVTEGDFV
jgi:hypothetical protein